MNQSLKILFAKTDNQNQIILIDPSLTSIDQEIIKLKIKQKQIIIALKNNKIIGLLRFSYFWNIKPYIDSIFVLKIYRRQKVGERMLVFLENYLINHRYCFLYTSSEEPAQEPQKWWRKMGFKKCGLIDKINLPTSKNKEVFYFKKLRKNKEQK